MSDTSIQDCLVCQKQQGILHPPGGVIYEDDLVYASHSFIPQDEASTYLGILFLEPRRHITGLEELTDEEGQRLGLMVAKLSRALERATDAEHIYLFVLGHTVRHLHFWLVPRYIGTPPEYYGLRVEEWPGAPQGGETEIADLVRRIKGYL